MAALYLSTDAKTALSEYHRGDPPRPVVLVSGILTAINLVDLTGDPSKWDPVWHGWDANWLDALEEHEAGFLAADCPSWRCGDAARAMKSPGILFRSIQNPGGKNLVLFPEDATVGTYHLSPIDPMGEIVAANPTK